MSWTKITIETDKEGLSLLPAILIDHDILGVEMLDPFEVQEFLKDPDKPWDYEDDSIYEKAKEKPFVSFYLEEKELDKLESIKKDLSIYEKDGKINHIIIKEEKLKDTNWAENWKKFYKPFPIGKLFIYPKWENYEEVEKDRRIIINPGHVFGTGQHESTKLCIELMQELDMQDKNIADIGCGSGILAIAGLKLEARKAILTEIVPDSERVINENMALNEVENYELIIGDLLSELFVLEKLEEEKRDIILINIVADVIIDILPHIHHFISKDGKIILSGIIDDRKEDVLTALEDEFTLIKVKEDGGWVGIIAQYKNE